VPSEQRNDGHGVDYGVGLGNIAKGARGAKVRHDGGGSATKARRCGHSVSHLGVRRARAWPVLATLDIAEKASRGSVLQEKGSEGMRVKRNVWTQIRRMGLASTLTW
jgi:hypothetical protein